MTAICLVRHGETDWNAMGKLQGREDVPLNNRGEEQAIMVGRYLKNTEFAAIYASPLLRAKETAMICNHFVGHLPLYISSDFIEKDYGQASGMTVVERDKHFPDGDIPDLESFDHICKRATEGIETIRGQFPDENVLLVAHGGLINVILAILSDGKIGTGKTKLFNTCISHIVSAGNSWKIIDYNKIDHLKSFGKVTSI
ncbi:histidine phosphatase family protein [Sporolactobacillus shoreae]|uniref:Histidine phosphatase family protein n=1 Tax=Sporolactobacillus shoreae TaxID=1465501 RepID=A0A4Z0GLW7_9BACL|nr:histidine phosphatase family protein [Sporolactobacillus shoreae]TGA97788.1 histidine phosphatase family protein [Sporolactobacillus shoreae]